ncbi:MAG: FtsX-like permease family protein [Propionibacteriaceae bacterium]|jgi:putative ABC transport system permease protein|nr:FtsX-like permease family protein [Propionibacteriaceae bacterium]
MKGVKVGVQGSPGRLVLAVLAVVLGMAVASFALFLRGSVTTTLSTVVDKVLSADVYILPADSSPADMMTQPKVYQKFLDSRVTAQISVIPEVRGVFSVYVGQVQLTKSDGTVVSSGVAPSVGIGVDTNEVESSRLIDGAFPTSPSEIAVEQATAERAGLSVGDKAQLIANGNRFDPEVTISGIVSYDSDLGGATVVFLNGIVARAVFSPSSMVPLIAVRVQDDASPADGRNAIEAALESEVDAKIVVGSELRKQTVSSAMNSLSTLGIGLLILAGLGVAIGGLLVGATFAGAQRENISTIATLKAFGATTSQVLGKSISQAAAVGFIGSIFGIAIGFVVAVLVRAIMTAQGLALSLGIPVIELALCFVAMMIVTILAAWLGSRRVANVAPREAINGFAAGRSGLGLVRVIIGVVLILAGVGAAMWVVFSSQSALIIYAGLVAILMGVLLAAPLLLIAFAPIFAAPLRLISSVSGRLAKHNLIRSPRPAANVAGVMILGFSLATAGLIIASTADAAIGDSLHRDVPADYVIQPDSGNSFIPDQAVAQVRQIPGLSVVAYGQAPVRVLNDEGKVLDADVLFGPPDTFSSSLSEVAIVDGAPEQFRDGLALNKAFADAQGIRVGDTLKLLVAQDTPHEDTLSLSVAVIVDSQFFRDVLIPTGLLIEPIPGHARTQFMPITTVFITAANEGTVQVLRDQIQEALSGYEGLKLSSRDEFISTPSPVVTQIRTAALILIGLVALVAIVGISVILGQAVIQREKNIGLMRISGASRGQMRRAVTFESLLICATSAFVGILGGVGLAYLGLRILPSLGMTTLVFPWLWIVGLFVVALLVGFVAGIAPARRAGSVPLLTMAA